MRKPIIAIDGPAGAGKSTVAKTVADRLGYVYIDTGAMYRAVALSALQNGIPVSDEKSIASLAGDLDIRFERHGTEQRLIVDGEDVTEQIRAQEPTRLSSPVSAIPGVRKRLVDLQRQMGSHGGVVMEGRDIGTVVFPDAEVKVFLTASVKERARRRFEQIHAMGRNAKLEQIEADIRDRDLRDSSRRLSPLKQAPDAHLVDTDRMDVEDVVNAVLAIYQERHEL